MRYKAKFKAVLAATMLSTIFASQANAADITLFRFFGDCANDFGTVSDISKAVGECGIVQVLTNKFNAENTIGAKVVTQTVDWNTYYDLLSATYTTGNIPDVAVMHRSVLPNFARRELIMPVGDELTKAGVDMNDWVPAAREAVTVNGKVYGIPFDIHALLVHINVDLMKQAGLTDGAGNPILPKSPQELIEQGKKFKEATGKSYIAVEANSSSAMMLRFFNSLVWQQGSDIIAADGKTSTIDTPQGLKAAELLDAIFTEGLSNKAYDYAGAEQAFLNGEAGLLLNGTWPVDNYEAQAKGGKGGLKNYKVANLPKLFDQDAVWADSHEWIIPMDANRPPEETQAAVAFLKFLDDNNYEWSRTGHLSVRQSVIDSDQFKALPHRSEYADTSKRARALPPIQNQRGIQDAMLSELNSIWLTDADPKTVLAQMQSRVDQAIRRGK